MPICKWLGKIGITWGWGVKNTLCSITRKTVVLMGILKKKVQTFKKKVPLNSLLYQSKISKENRPSAGEITQVNECLTCFRWKSEVFLHPTRLTGVCSCLVTPYSCCFFVFKKKKKRKFIFKF